MKKTLLILVPLFILGTLLAAPLNEGFESATCPPSEWTIRYANPSPPSGNLMTHSTTYFYEGSRSFRFSSLSSGSPYDQYLITPQLIVTAGDQTVSFWYRGHSTLGSEVFRVGWSSTGTEIANFTWSEDITNASTTWQQYVKTDLPVETKYVAVHYKSVNQYYLYIDAFVGPQIAVPPNPAVLVSPANGGLAFLDDTLSWTNGGGIVDGYKLYISDDNIVNEEDFITDQEETTYSLSDLEDLVIEYDHTYYWKVVPYNEYGLAEGCPVWSFKTPTETQLAESFESATCPPNGWTIRYANSNPPSGNLMTHSTNYAYLGSRSFRFSSRVYGPSYDQYLITPKLTVTDEDKTVSFWYRRYTYGFEEFRVGWSSTGTEISDFTWSTDITNASPSWQQYVKTDLPVGTKYVAVHYKSNYQCYLYIDAFVGPEIAAEPPDPAVLIRPYDSGWAFLDNTLSWTSSGGIVDGYKLYISDDATVDNDDYITDQTVTTYSLSDLEDLVIEYDHTYYWKVVPYNEYGPAEGCPVWSFKTPTETQLAESFENTDFPPRGWARTTPSTDYWARTTYYYTHGSACMYAGTSISTVYDISTPKCTITSGSALNFSTRASNTNQKLQILYSTDRETWTQIGTDITYAAANVWYNISIDLSAYAGEKYLAFRSPAQTSTGSIDVDAVFGPELTQAPPDPAVLIRPSDGGWAFLDDTLSWTGGGGGIADGYKLYISEDDNVNADDFITDQTGTTYSLSVLEDLVIEYSHTYYWQVIPYNENGPAAGCEVWSFKTPTAAQLAESFESTNFPPLCWANPGSWIRSTTYAKHGSASAYQCGSTTTQYILSTPKVTITSTSTLDLWALCTSTSGILQIVYSEDRTTWTQLEDITIDTAKVWYHNEIDLSSLASNNYYLGFRTGLQDVGFYVDCVFGPEITPEAPEAPTLVSPADGAENVSIIPTFSWTAATLGGVPDGFKIYCGNPIDYDNPIATVPRTTTSYTIPGTNALQYNTIYQWTVSAYKDGFDEARAAERSFITRTDPTITTFPYVTDFSTWMPTNWTQLRYLYGGTPASGGDWFQGDWLNITSPVNKAAKINIYYNNHYDWLVTPPIQIPATGYELEFDLAVMKYGTQSTPVEPGEQADDRLLVVISNNPDMSSPTILMEWNNTGSPNVYDNIPATGETYIIDLDSYVGTKYIGFYAESLINTDDNDLMVDNVIIRQVTTGPDLYYTPTSLNFGEVALGVQVGPKKVTVTNLGIGDLILNKADNTQIIGSGFAIDDFNFSLEHNESEQINVYANATHEGLFTAILRITYGGNDYDVSLSATGLPEGIIVIGTGTEELGLPIDPYYRYSYSQSIFLQGEINKANRNIEKIYYYWNGAGAASNSNVWTVYLGHTDKTAFDSTSDWIPITGFSVYEVTLDLSAGEGWIEINLDPPFYHTDQNLVIAVDENIYGYDSYPNVYFYCTLVETKGNRSISYAADSTNPVPATPPAGALVSGYPNIKLEFEEIPTDPRVPLPYTQDFGTDGTWPLNWTQTYSGEITSNRWSLSYTNYAGGTPYEMNTSYVLVSETGISRLISPPIITAGVSAMNIRFRTYYEDWYFGITAKLQYSHDLTTWYDTSWSIISGGGNVSGLMSVLITDLNSPTTYIAWTLDGDHYQFNYWSIDDVVFSQPPNHDVAPVSWDLPVPVVGENTLVTPKATVINNGLNTETFTVTCTIGDSYTNIQTVNNLGLAMSQQVTFAPLTPALWTVSLVTVTTNLSMDEVTENDTLQDVLICLPLDTDAVAENLFTYNFVQFNLATPGTMYNLPNPPLVTIFMAGADWTNGKWLGCEYDVGTLATDNFWEINAMTGASTLLGEMGADIMGIAYDDNHNILYGTDGVNLYTMNVNTGAATLSGALWYNLEGTPTDLEDMYGFIIDIAYDNHTNTLYGIDLASDCLWQINVSTRELTLKGFLGIDLDYAQDAAFDQVNGLLFLAGYAGGGALYWIDTEYGGAYKVGNFPENAEVTAFSIPYGLISVPEVTIASNGTISWTPVSGAIKYSIYKATDPYGTFSWYADAFGTSWTDPNFTTDAMAFYKVTSVGGMRNVNRQEIRYSNPIQHKGNLNIKHRYETGLANQSLMPTKSKPNK
ncbi:MAG: choice-of-anchor J domain-containing protein [Candidatus Cloacimonadaceae bacterium]